MVLLQTNSLPTLKVGDIYFLKTNTLFGKLIREFTDGEFNHCGIIGNIGTIPNGSDKGNEGVLIYEAISRGFVASWYPLYWLNARYGEGKVYFKRPKQKLSNIKQNCDKYLGKPYGFSDLVTIVLAKFIPGLRNKDTVKTLICSEAVSKVLYDSSKSINFQKEYNKSYSHITPQDIYKSKFVKEI